MRSWPSNQPTDWQRMGFLAILIFTALSQTCKGSFWKVSYLISCMRILVSLLCVSWRSFLYINFIFQEIVFVEVSSLIPCLIFGLFFTSLIRSDQAESFIWINIVSIYLYILILTFPTAAEALRLILKAQRDDENSSLDVASVSFCVKMIKSHN